MFGICDRNLQIRASLIALKPKKVFPRYKFHRVYDTLILGQLRLEGRFETVTVFLFEVDRGSYI